MVTGWLVKMVLIVVIVGTVGFDAVSLLSARAGVGEDATDAAIAAATAWQSSHSQAMAITAAEHSLGTHSETLVPGSVHFLAQGQVRLTLRRKAPTVLMSDIPFLKKYITVTASGQGGPATL
jgi:hypothetical protein